MKKTKCMSTHGAGGFGSVSWKGSRLVCKCGYDCTDALDFSIWRRNIKLSGLSWYAARKSSALIDYILKPDLIVAEYLYLPDFIDTPKEIKEKYLKVIDKRFTKEDIIEYLSYKF